MSFQSSLSANRSTCAYSPRLCSSRTASRPLYVVVVVVVVLPRRTFGTSADRTATTAEASTATNTPATVTARANDGWDMGLLRLTGVQCTPGGSLARAD